MDWIAWNLLLGLVLTIVALASGVIPLLPLSYGMLYLGLGVLLGPIGLGLIAVHPIADAHWLERISEVAVIVSLFVGGLKLRLPLRASQWRIAYRLAGPAMVYSIAGMGLLAYLLGLDPAMALLLGAILAPTDPVLASEVTVNGAEDHDRLRYGLSGEAGLNDGMAFPFLVLALLWMQQGGWGAWVGGWVLADIVWAVPAGLLLGYGMGVGMGHLAVYVRRRGVGSASSDLLLLALIALSYGMAELIHAWGFLAVFAAAVGLRRTEVMIVRGSQTPLPSSISNELPIYADMSPAEVLVERPVDRQALRHPAVAAGLILSELSRFGETLERILALLMVTLVGVMIAPLWDWRGMVLGLGLLLLIRPLAVQLALIQSPATAAQRGLMGWFGLRGIGSLYYLSHAIGEGIGRERAEDATSIVLTVMAISIFLHGTTVTPLLSWYEKGLKRREAMK